MSNKALAASGRRGRDILDLRVVVLFCFVSFLTNTAAPPLDVEMEMTECFNVASTATIHQLGVNLCVPFTC